MLDLNQEDFVHAARITEDDIYNKLSDEAVFKYYIKDLVIGRIMESPLKAKDNHPSFGVYHSQRYNKLMFKDQSLDISGDCVEFVRQYFRLGSKYEACSKIALDFRIEEEFVISKNITRSIIPPSKSVFEKSNYSKDNVVIDIQSRTWERHDLDFWEQFGINKSTLDKFLVKPVKFIFINGAVIAAAKHSYAYKEIKDHRLSYKIYQPFNSNKWVNNATSDTHQGYTLLPKTGELLIITKSLKDVMSIYEVTGIPSIGIQSENVMIKDSVMGEYKSRFKKVICLFDNDRAGQKLANRYTEEYNIPSIVIPKKFNSKDFSDLVKYYNKKIAYNILNNLINGDNQSTSY